MPKVNREVEINIPDLSSYVRPYSHGYEAYGIAATIAHLAGIGEEGTWFIPSEAADIDGIDSQVIVWRPSSVEKLIKDYGTNIEPDIVVRRLCDITYSGHRLNRTRTDNYRVTLGPSIHLDQKILEPSVRERVIEFIPR